MGERWIRAFDQSNHPNLWINKDFKQRRTSNLTFSKIDLKLHTEGALRPIKNRKTVNKIVQNRRTEKKIQQNRKPHAKLSKSIHFHILVIKTLIDPIQW